jgi:hypothetical protein
MRLTNRERRAGFFLVFLDERVIDGAVAFAGGELI